MHYWLLASISRSSLSYPTKRQGTKALHKSCSFFFPQNQGQCSIENKIESLPSTELMVTVFLNESTTGPWGETILCSVDTRVHCRIFNIVTSGLLSTPESLWQLEMPLHIFKYFQGWEDPLLAEGHPWRTWEDMRGRKAIPKVWTCWVFQAHVELVVYN